MPQHIFLNILFLKAVLIEKLNGALSCEPMKTWVLLYIPAEYPYR